MRILLLFFIGITILSCSNSNSSSSGKASAGAQSYNFDWMLGDWQRSNNAENQTTYEQWKKDGTGEYLGMGVTLEKRDTVFYEDMALTKVKGVWNLKVSGVNEQPTFFKVTHRGKEAFTCENPENEFPTSIAYWREGDLLKAQIAGGGDKVTFDFERKIVQ